MTLIRTQVPRHKSLMPVLRSDNTAIKKAQSAFARGAYSEGLSSEDFLNQGGWFDVTAGNGGASGTGAWRVGVVYAAIKVISETVAALPFALYRKTGKVKEIDEAHKAQELYATEPNDKMTWFNFFSTLIAVAITKGDSFALITRDFFGYPTSYDLLLDGVCQAYIEKSVLGIDEVFYIVNGVVIPRKDIIHIRCIGSNGLKGQSAIELAKKAVLGALEQQDFVVSMTSNGLNLEGVLETTISLSDDAYKKLKTDMKDFRTAKNANGTLILENGLTYKPVSLKPQDAQFIENRNFTSEDLCRFIGVPQHKVGLLGKSTNNNIEHQDLEFYKTSVSAWVTNIQQEFDSKALLKKERIGNTKRMHKFDLLELLLADSKARSEFYNSLFPKGAISPDEIREREGMNPNGNDASTKTYVQLAMSDIEKLDENRKVRNPGGKRDIENENED